MSAALHRSHIVFDLDGTLVDSAVHCAAILSEMLQERGSCRLVGRDDAAPHMSYGGPHLVTSLLAADCGDPAQELADFRSRLAARPTPTACLFPGVLEGLAALASAGFVLGVCSNKPQPLCDKIVDEVGLRPFVRSVVGGRPGLAPKPDRAMLDLNLTKMAGSTGQALLIGDSEVDHALAGAADIPFWLVSYGYPGAGWKAQADARFDRFGDVVTALLAPLRSPGNA